MDTYVVELNADEFERLNSLYPQSNGSGPVGKRADAIVRIHLQRRSPGCIFHNPDLGADLKVIFCDGSAPLLIEVKGTASSGIEWAQLKASSQHSHRLLVDECIPVYRVSDVFSPTPAIYVLKHGVDFVLVPEDRWTFRPSGVAGVSEETQRPRIVSGAVRRNGVSGASKYDALRSYLEQQEDSQVTLGFKDAEKLLGFSLPASALKYQAFWANQSDTANRPWARAWQDAGYEVESTRLSGVDGWVRFRRRRI